MILLIDNYDSFTYNLFQQISSFGVEVHVVRNDELTIEDIRALNPQAIVLSPGPGTPDDAGICLEVVKELYKDYPILGICLGHQTIAQAFDGKIIRAQDIMHGRYSTLMHTGQGLLQHCQEKTQIMRYHSLVVEQSSFPYHNLRIAALSEDGEIMALQHRMYPVYGLQFHPESFGTSEGNQMIENFLQSIAALT